MRGRTQVICSFSFFLVSLFQSWYPYTKPYSILVLAMKAIWFTVHTTLWFYDPCAQDVRSWESFGVLAGRWCFTRGTESHQEAWNSTCRLCQILCWTSEHGSTHKGMLCAISTTPWIWNRSLALSEFRDLSCRTLSMNKDKDMHSTNWQTS